MSKTLLYNSNKPRLRAACIDTGGAALLGAYLRWLGIWLAALKALLRALAGGEDFVVLITEGDAPDELFCGFRRIVRVPAELFDCPPRGEGEGVRVRVPAGAGEDELLDCIRRLEEFCGERFDWDAFSERCEKDARRTRRILSLACALVPGFLRSAPGLSPAERLRSIAGDLDDKFEIWEKTK